MEAQKIKINTATITLVQLLKFSGVASSGAEAKKIIEEGLASVNGKPETVKHRKLVSGDLVVIGDVNLEVV